MSTVPAPSAISDEQRRANDGHRHWVPVVVIAFLLLVAYLWTDWMADYPPPGLSAVSQHTPFGWGVSDSGHLSTESWINYGSGLGGDAERRILLLLAGVGFLLSYYLPLGLKKQPLVVLTLLGVAWVFGPATLGRMLAVNLAAYATFHRPAPRRTATRIGVAVLALGVSFPETWPGWSGVGLLALKTVLGAVVVGAVYTRVYHPLLGTRIASRLQTCVAHSALIYLVVALIWNWSAGSSVFYGSMGLFLFFWQWERLVMYRIDLKDGRVPLDLPLFEYLATFFTPAFLSNVSWLNRIPKGYAYTANAFFARDKNRVVLSGVWLIGLSVFFFYLQPVALGALYLGLGALDLPQRTSYAVAVAALDEGATLPAVWVWGVMLYHFFNFYLLWTAVAHLKVGLWRLFGYDIETHFQKPFASTNLLEFWKRYSYYYREFLVQAFYIPVFLRVFKRRPYLRIMTATLAAATFGNLTFHIMEDSLYSGSTPEVWRVQLETLPYYLLLGLAVGLTQIWILARGRRGRRPWTGGWRVGFDVVAVVGTVGYYVVIRTFRHVPMQHSFGYALRIVAAAFGIDM